MGVSGMGGLLLLAALLGDIAAFDAVETVLGLLLLQLLAAILGGWTGRRLALGGSSVV